LSGRQLKFTWTADSGAENVASPLKSAVDRDRGSQWSRLSPRPESPHSFVPRSKHGAQSTWDKKDAMLLVTVEKAKSTVQAEMEADMIRLQRRHNSNLLEANERRERDIAELVRGAEAQEHHFAAQASAAQAEIRDLKNTILRLHRQADAAETHAETIEAMKIEHLREISALQGRVLNVSRLQSQVDSENSSKTDALLKEAHDLHEKEMASLGEVMRKEHQKEVGSVIEAMRIKHKSEVKVLQDKITKFEERISSNELRAFSNMRRDLETSDSRSKQALLDAEERHQAATASIIMEYGLKLERMTERLTAAETAASEATAAKTTADKSTSKKVLEYASMLAKIKARAEAAEKEAQTVKINENAARMALKSKSASEAAATKRVAQLTAELEATKATAREQLRAATREVEAVTSRSNEASAFAQSEASRLKAANEALESSLAEARQELDVSRFATSTAQTAKKSAEAFMMRCTQEVTASQEAVKALKAGNSAAAIAHAKELQRLTTELDALRSGAEGRGRGASSSSTEAHLAALENVHGLNAKVRELEAAHAAVAKELASAKATASASLKAKETADFRAGTLTKEVELAKSIAQAAMESASAAEAKAGEEVDHLNRTIEDLRSRLRARQQPLATEIHKLREQLAAASLAESSTIKQLQLKHDVEVRGLRDQLIAFTSQAATACEDDGKAMQALSDTVGTLNLELSEAKAAAAEHQAEIQRLSRLNASRSSGAAGSSPSVDPGQQRGLEELEAVVEALKCREAAMKSDFEKLLGEEKVKVKYLEGRMDDLARQFVRVEADHAVAIEASKALEAALQEEKKSEGEAVAQLEVVQQAYGQSREDMAEASSLISNAKHLEQIRALEEKCGDAENENAKHIEEIRLLEGKCRDAENGNAKRLKELRVLEEKCHGLESTNAKHLKEIRVLEEKCRDVENDNAKRLDEIRILTDKCRNVVDDGNADKKAKELEFVRKERQEVAADLEALKMVHDALKQEHADVLSSQQKTVAELSEKIDSLQEDVDSYVEELQTMESEHADELRDVKENLEKQRGADLSEAWKSNSKHLKEIEALEQKCFDIENEGADQLMAMQEQYQEASEQLTALQKGHAAALNDHDAEVLALTEKIKAAQAEVDEKVDELRTLRSEHSKELRAATMKLEKQHAEELAEARRENSASSDDAANNLKHIEEIEALEQQCRKAESEGAEQLETMREFYQDASDQLAALQKQHAAALNEHEAEIDALTEKIKAAQANADEKVGELHTLRSEHAKELRATTLRLEKHHSESMAQQHKQQAEEAASFEARLRAQREQQRIEAAAFEEKLRALQEEKNRDRGPLDDRGDAPKDPQSTLGIVFNAKEKRFERRDAPPGQVYDEKKMRFVFPKTFAPRSGGDGGGGAPVAAAASPSSSVPSGQANKVMEKQIEQAASALREKDQELQDLSAQHSRAKFRLEKERDDAAAASQSRIDALTADIESVKSTSAQEMRVVKAKHAADLKAAEARHAVDLEAAETAAFTVVARSVEEKERKRSTESDRLFSVALGEMSRWFKRRLRAQVTRAWAVWSRHSVASRMAAAHRQELEASARDASIALRREQRARMQVTLNVMLRRVGAHMTVATLAAAFGTWANALARARAGDVARTMSLAAPLGMSYSSSLRVTQVRFFYTAHVVSARVARVLVVCVYSASHGLPLLDVFVVHLFASRTGSTAESGLDPRRTHGLAHR